MHGPSLPHQLHTSPRNSTSALLCLRPQQLGASWENKTESVDEGMDTFLKHLEQKHLPLIQLSRAALVPAGRFFVWILTIRPISIRSDILRPLRQVLWIVHKIHHHHSAQYLETAHSGRPGSYRGFPGNICTYPRDKERFAAWLVTEWHLGLAKEEKSGVARCLPTADIK